jgi:aminoglycoside phosphotransferase (APT) family kinase protein
MNVADADAILRAHVDPGLEAVSVDRGTVGNSQETWFVEARAADGEPVQLVLRRTAPAGVLAWTDRAQEYAVLRALAGRGLPVPDVLAIGVDERPFLVMQRLPGVPPGRLGEDERISLGRELGTFLARLHALDPGELGLASDETAAAATLAQVRQYQRLYESARPAPVPLLGALLAWAERNRPQDEVRSAVLWGDPGAHNLLVADGHVSALLDWELTHVGDPLDDLGAAVWSCLGSLDPEAVVAGYEEIAGGVDRQRLSYFVALACATRSVMVVNGTAAWLEGSVRSPANAALGLELLALDLARGARAAGWGDLPASDGLAPRYPLRPDPAETAAGVGHWLLDDLAPALDDRRLRQMTKRAAALLAATAARIPPSHGLDPVAAEADAVAAEKRGGDASIRGALLADLAREIERLEPLARLHGHPSPARAAGGGPSGPQAVS